MNFSDFAHNLLTGQWRIDRMIAKERFAIASHYQAQRMQLYAGAQPGTKRPTPSQLSTPEDYKQAFQRIVLIRAARQMEEDFPFFDGILNDFQTYVVGELKFTPSTGNPDADKVISEFLEWKFDTIDITGREDLCSLAKLAVRSMKRDGEMGAVFRMQDDDLKLQEISGDRIGNPSIGTGPSPTDFGGIVVDPDTGAPENFNIYRRLPKVNAYTFQMAVPADQFLHYFDPFRIEQYHGVTIFKNCIENGWDAKQIADFARLNMKYRAAQLPSIKNEQGRPRGNGYEVTANANGGQGPYQFDVDGVTQTFFKNDDGGAVEYPNDFPNQQFLPAMTELKRECAVGAKLPLEFVYRSEAGGVVQRFYVDKAEATFRGDRHLLRRKLLNPAKNRTIKAGLQSGELDLSAFGNLADSLLVYRGTWQMGRAVSVDYGKETDADIKKMESGIISPYALAQEDGSDLNVVLAETEKYTTELIKAGQRISTETGVDLTEVLPYLSKRFPNQAPQTAADSALEEVDTNPATR